MTIRWLVCALVACPMLAYSALGFAAPIAQWLPTEMDNAVTYMMRNVSPPGAAPGAVLASPSQSNPDYYYHWVRDASMTMDTVVTLYERAPDSASQQKYLAALLSFVDFSRKNQQTANPSGLPWTTGLGEPKFNVDGSAFTGQWGRPQNDGPALRVLALSHFARVLLAQGHDDIVRQKLYASSIPATTVIKADLEYIAHYWQDPSFDLWEEVLGTHFFTRAAIRNALLVGADLATRMNDPGAAQYYTQQAQAVAADLERHWDANRGYVVETLDSDGNGKGKTSNLDSGVILGALIGCDAARDFPCPSSDRILATAAHLEDAFRQIYPINQLTSAPGIGKLGLAIGRYPEDQYSGVSTSAQGNPWFILTAAFAELSYRAADEFRAAGVIAVDPLNHEFLANALAGENVTLNDGEKIHSSDPRFQAIVSALHDGGDGFLNRVQYHTNAQGALSEQMNRYTGFMQSANDLSWSYASFLTAFWAR